MTGVVERIYITGSGSQHMERVRDVKALEGCGLEGDRYCEGTGYWSGVDECQVTLIAREGLDAIAAEGLAIHDGQHRRNLVVRGLNLDSLVDQDFVVGGAVLAYDRPRPPCSHVQKLSEPGMLKALARHGGGICARVVRGGTIREGDAVEQLSTS